MQITLVKLLAQYLKFTIVICNGKSLNMIIVKYNDGDNELIFYDDVVTVTAMAHRILNSIT